MAKDLYALSSYLYDLPEELVAQAPCEPRDSSRLMIIDRKSGTIRYGHFRDLLSLCNPGDSFVVNNTKVIPARLIGTRKNGGVSEVFLTYRHADGTWDALVRPAKKLPVGSRVDFSASFSCEMIGVLADGGRHVKFLYDGDLDNLLEQYGQVPLPHYIRRDAIQKDRDTYQTLYAEKPGAVAAPTAGLHFTQDLLEKLQAKDVDRIAVTLHVGQGTFKPVQVEDVRKHAMHYEFCEVSEDAVHKLNKPLQASSKRICVGTTCCRALESAADPQGKLSTGSFKTNIFIYPGYQFKYVDTLLTNFHLPGSTLLMLVSAFAGYELIMEAYAKAVEQRFRFYSYGDAMLIL